MGRWFGTDGIRGRAGEAPLTPVFLGRLGRALGEQAGPGGLVLVARDTRESGPGIAADLEGGIVGAGATVLDLGVVPTPGLPLSMRDREAAIGIVVSASHNPWEDNGVKVFGRGGMKLSDAHEAEVEARIEALGGLEPDPAAEASEASEPACEQSETRSLDGAAEYVAHMRSRFEGLDLSGLHIVADCAHGAASSTAPPVLSALGARLTVVADAPDGRNINAGCGSTHLDHVAAAVVAAGADLGLAFDGDADRVLMVDASGRHCTGDHMLGFLGTMLHAEGRLPGNTLVATVMTNLGLEKLLTAAGIRLLRTSVGDRHVLAAMMAGTASGGAGTTGSASEGAAAETYSLGGEASGHLLFHETAASRQLGGHDAFLGDGLYTALRVLEQLVSRGRDLASVIDAVEAVPQVLLNLKVAARPPLESLPALQARVAQAEAAHGQEIRIVLRYSGTENLARVMVEGTDADVVDATSRDLARLWEESIAGVTP